MGFDFYWILLPLQKSFTSQVSSYIWILAILEVVVKKVKFFPKVISISIFYDVNLL